MPEPAKPLHRPLRPAQREPHPRLGRGRAVHADAEPADASTTRPRPASSPRSCSSTRPRMPGASRPGDERDRPRATAVAWRVGRGGHARARRAARRPVVERQDDARHRRRARAPGGRAIVAEWERALESPAERAPNGRRTTVITGRPEGAPRPLSLVPAERRRPSRTPAEWIGPRPERIVAWAFVLGLLLILIAISTADAVSTRQRPERPPDTARAAAPCGRRRPVLHLQRVRTGPSSPSRGLDEDTDEPLPHPRRPHRTRGVASRPEGRDGLRRAAPELPRRAGRLAGRAARVRALPLRAAPRRC